MEAKEEPKEKYPVLDLMYFPPFQLPAADLFIYVQESSALMFDFDLLSTTTPSSSFKALFRTLADSCQAGLDRKTLFCSNSCSWVSSFCRDALGDGNYAAWPCWLDRRRITEYTRAGVPT